MTLDLFSYEQITGKSLEETYPWMKEKTFTCVKDIEQLAGLVDAAIKAGMCSLDLESSGLDTRVYDGKSKDFIVGFSFSYNGVDGWYVPINHGHKNDRREYVRSQDKNLDPEQVNVHIQRLVDQCICIFHNCIFDHEMMHANGYTISEPKEKEEHKFHDTMILGRLFDMGSKRIGLKHLSDTLLDAKMIELKELFQKGEEVRFNLLDPHEKRTIVYACSDAICTYNLFKFYEKTFVLTDKRAKFIYNIERSVTFATREMERNKCRIDLNKLRESKIILDQYRKELEERANKEVGEVINLSSPTKLGEVLVNKYGLKDLESKEEKGKIHTDSEYLAKHKNLPIVDTILQHRDIMKTVSTYVDNFLGGHDALGDVKFQFIPTRTDTGRFASPGGEHEFGYSGVNVQALTAADDDAKKAKDRPFIERVKEFGAGFWLRSVIIGRPGYVIVAIDYSGEELRVGANLSREPVWIKEFLENDGDLHMATARLIFGPNPTKDDRKKAKIINFQILYGGGPFAVSQATGLSKEEAKHLIAKFFAGLKGIKRWMDQEKAACKKRLYAETPFGRRRPLPEINNKEDFSLQSHAERLAINTPIQGAGGDIMKMAMIRTHRYAKKTNGEVRMLLTIHDELVFEIKEDKLDVHVPELMNLMSLHDILSSPQYKWPVPLSMDCEVGNSWDVDYEYFERNPKQLDKLHKVLRDMKARALGLDLETLEPLDAKTPKTPEPEPVKESAKVEVELVTETPLEAEPVEDTPTALALRVFKQNLPPDVVVSESLENSFRAGLDKFIESNPVKAVQQEEADALKGDELVAVRLQLPIAWKKYVYTLQNPVISEEKALLLKLLLKTCEIRGSNPFTLKDHKGEILVEGRHIDAVKFEVLAGHYNI